MIRLLHVSIILTDAIFDICQMWCAAFPSELSCALVSHSSELCGGLPQSALCTWNRLRPFVFRVLSSKVGASGGGLNLVSGL